MPRRGSKRNAVGTGSARRWTEIRLRRLRSILRQPTEAMIDENAPVDVKDEDLTALIAFLESLK